MRCSKDFAIDGADGYTAAEASLSTGETIERVFTYSAHYPFYSDALQCADRSGAADVGGRRYTYWLLPANGEDACVASDGKYSLVVAVNERGADDAALSTVENAELYGMKVYLGMPIPQMGQPGTSGYPAYVADDSYMGTLGAFTRNLLRSWMQAFGARTSFAGLYQGRETSVVQDHRRSPAHAQRLCVPERRCRRLPAGGEAPRRVQPLRLFRGSEPCGIFRGPVPGHRAYGCRKGRRHPRAPGRRRHGEGEPERPRTRWPRPRMSPRCTPRRRTRARARRGRISSCSFATARPVGREASHSPPTAAPTRLVSISRSSSPSRMLRRYWPTTGPCT